MKINLNKIIIVFLLLNLFSAKISAQIDSATVARLSFYFSRDNILQFGDFLFQKGDYLRAAAEYQRYLFLDFPGQPYAHYQIGNCFLKSQNADQAAEYFRKAALDAPRPSFKDSATVAFLASLLFAQKNELFCQKIDSIPGNDMQPSLRTDLLALKGFYFLRHKQWHKAIDTFKPTIPAQISDNIDKFQPLVDIASRGMNIPKKSPALAGLFSALLPGTGKIYAGRTPDGLYSLVLVAGTAWLAYDGFNNNGLSSSKGWVFGSLATILYAGNIYGSVVAVQLYNNRYEQRLEHDIEAQLSVWFNF